LKILHEEEYIGVKSGERKRRQSVHLIPGTDNSEIIFLGMHCQWNYIRWYTLKPSVPQIKGKGT